MVRQGLRSLLNGHANLLHFPPHPRKAGKPGSRKAGKPKGSKSKPGKPGEAEIPKSRISLGQADTKSRVRLPVRNRYATLPCGMPRHKAPCGDKNISCFSSHYFPVKASRLPNPQPRYSQLLEGKVKGASNATASLLLLYP